LGFSDKSKSEKNKMTTAEDSLLKEYFSWNSSTWNTFWVFFCSTWNIFYRFISFLCS
jgi:hypothetical protein